MTNAPYPLDQPRLTTDIHGVLARHGGSFDGAAFMLMEEMIHPQQELFFIVGVTPEAARRTKNTMRTSFTLAETPHGQIVEIRLTLTDRIIEPTAVFTHINPAIPEARDWLDRLSKQECFNVQMFDKDTAQAIKMTRLPLHEDLQETLQQILAATSEHPEQTYEQWQKCLAYYCDNAAPPAGHIRLAPHQRGPKYARNDPCFCGSGIKYKKCCGR